MIRYNKLCDAADWFRPTIDSIIRNELREIPRFHRKQWESAMIFHVLRDCGKLQPSATGLSMGSGRERIAYALAQHVSQLSLTDLYETESIWDCAKASDPNEYIRMHKPFPVDDAKLNAQHMDMRELNFPAKKFDFAYSCCAVEHIGDHEDFVKHFNEVARVLKEDGVYVFTTEIHFGTDTIRDDHNYVFSLPDLQAIIAESGLVVDGDFDARVSCHKINYPLPSTLSQLAHHSQNSLAAAILDEAPHLHLLRGKHPFTCAVFVLRKRTAHDGHRRIAFVGLEETRAFADTGVTEYRRLLENARVELHPFSGLAYERSRCFTDHEEFCRQNDRGDAHTPFHTAYVWWGSGRRLFEVALHVDAVAMTGDPEIEIRLHRFKTLDSAHVECVASVKQPVQRAGWMVRRFELVVDEDSCYAVVGKLHATMCLFDKIEVRSCPSHLAESHHREVLRNGFSKQEAA